MTAPVDPMPPVADVALPWDRELADPVAALAAARAECGDTFVVAGPAHATLFLFSPTGVRSFYALPEATASKGDADWMMLRRKLPDERFAGRRTRPHELFGRDDAREHLRALDAAIDVAVEELGEAGTVDLFACTRRLGHRMGLAAWAGETPGRGLRFETFVADKRDERAAMAVVEALLAETVAARDALAADARPDDLLARVMRQWDDCDEPARTTGIARDVILLHLASMSNLFAAAGWMLAQLVLHPDVLARVRAGDEGLLERCALESTRLSQRSVMLRAVLVPVDVDDGDQTYRVAPGAQVATLLPLTNTTAARGLDRYDPDRWLRRRLRDEGELPARELVTTFGHGEHTCPAQPFSLAALCRAADRLVATYELRPAPGFTRVAPLAVQIGGVARSQDPCEVRYRAR